MPDTEQQDAAKATAPARAGAGASTAVATTKSAAPAEAEVPTYTHQQILRRAPELIGHAAWIVAEAIRKDDALPEKDFVTVDEALAVVEKFLEHEVVKPGGKS